MILKGVKTLIFTWNYVFLIDTSSYILTLTKYNVTTTHNFNKVND